MATNNPITPVQTSETNNMGLASSAQNAVNELILAYNDLSRSFIKNLMESVISQALIGKDVSDNIMKGANESANQTLSQAIGGLALGSMEMVGAVASGVSERAGNQSVKGEQDELDTMKEYQGEAKKRLTNDPDKSLKSGTRKQIDNQDKPLDTETDDAEVKKHIDDAEVKKETDAPLDTETDDAEVKKHIDDARVKKETDAQNGRMKELIGKQDYSDLNLDESGAKLDNETISDKYVIQNSDRADAQTLSDNLDKQINQKQLDINAKRSSFHGRSDRIMAASKAVGQIGQAVGGGVASTYQRAAGKYEAARTLEQSALSTNQASMSQASQSANQYAQKAAQESEILVGLSEADIYRG